MPLLAIAYCSQVSPGVSLLQIDELAEKASAHNLNTGVTGVLLTDGKRFLQYIEGPEQGVAAAYLRITSASSHLRLLELGRSVGAARRFPHWSMRWLAVEPEDLRIAEVSDWRGLATRQEVSMFQVPTGIECVTALINPYIGCERPPGCICGDCGW